MADPYEPCVHVALYQPEIPANAGSIGRTCLALSAKLWLVRPLGFRMDDRSLRRAGLDYWERLAWQAVDDWEELAARLPVDRFWYFTRHGERPYTEAAFAKGDVLLFGSESQGLPESVRRAAGDRALRIPTSDAVRSLNLSNAVAVAGYEALRQWTQPGRAGGNGLF